MIARLLSGLPGSQMVPEMSNRNVAQWISVLKARARSLAKLKGHDAEVVAAFIDSDIELKRGETVLSKKGEILSWRPM